MRLGTAVTLAFALLSIPPLVIVLIYGNRRNEAAMVESLDRQLGQTVDRSARAVSALVDTVARVLALSAEAVAADPARFRTDASEGVLWRALAAADQIDAAYVSFEDGYHRVVSRIDDDRRRSDLRIPANAHWHASHIDAFTDGASRERHRRFYDARGARPLAAYDQPTTLDIRTLDHYVQARGTRRLSVNRPSINPDTGSPVMSLGWPVEQDGRYLGFVGANMTLGHVSAYLSEHRVSAHSVTLIADDEGRVVAHSEPGAKVVLKDGKAELVTLEGFPDARVVQAARRRAEAREHPLRFTTSEGVDVSVASRPFPAQLGKSWEILIVAPVDDFVGELKATNRAVSQIVALLIALELLVIALMARRMSREIAQVSERFSAVRELNLQAPRLRPSLIGEISELQDGFSLLLAALGSFAKFVPVGVVRGFVRSGRSVEPSVEHRTLSILFCDLEGFSEHSERMHPDDLLHQLTQYFSVVTGAVREEHGTVDKFIGDAVMAFWGAPEAHGGHELQACRAALKAQRRMVRLQEQWRAEGRPVMRLRIGLHAADVLVGNIGSEERLSYTAIGDGVNVASRLEGANKALGTTVCLSETMRRAVGEALVARPIKPITVKGRQQAFVVYEPLGITGEEGAELTPAPDDRQLQVQGEQALALRTAGDLAGCVAAYRAILDSRPEDEVTRRLLAELEQSGVARQNHG